VVIAPKKNRLDHHEMNENLYKDPNKKVEWYFNKLKQY